MTAPRPADRLGEALAPEARPPGVRVVLDLRPLQDPGRAPTTAAYLERLLGAYAADPLPGESFVLLLQAGGADPSDRFPGLAVAGRRRLPPTRLLRSGALALDPFLIRGAEIGTAFRAARTGAAGAVFHTAGGPVPLAAGLPTVATLLDLAPWELPHAYQASPAAWFGQRLRGRLLRDAGAVIVGAQATALAARRLLHLAPEGVHVIPLAPTAAFGPGRPAASAPLDPAFAARLAREREALGLPERFLVFFGRYDARKDLGSLLAALALLRSSGRPGSLAAGSAWPPVLLLVGASPEDRAAVARAAARAGVGDQLAYAPHLEPARLGVLVAGARAVVLPAISEATGLPVIEALASGTPVVASAVGANPELVGRAGILVEPRDPGRLARALGTVWADDAAHGRLLAAALERAAGPRRTWADVARETRQVYAATARAPGLRGRTALVVPPR